MGNCKIGRQYYSFDNLKRIADKLGFNPDGRSMYFFNKHFYSNIFNPILIFDTDKKQWNLHELINAKQRGKSH